MLIPTNTITIKDAKRLELASLMADYEREHGPVHTTPIRVSAAPEFKFRVAPASTKKPQVEKEPVVRASVLLKRQRTQTIRELAAQGLNSTRIAERMGLRRKYISDLAYQAGISLPRGPLFEAAK